MIDFFRNYKYTILLVLIIGFAIIVLQYMLDQRGACHDRGGAYVKGAIGYECVERQ